MKSDFAGEIYCLESSFNSPKTEYFMSETYSIDKEFIEKQYFENNKSQEEIAKMLGISQWVISNRMRKYGFKTKKRTWRLHKKIYSLDESFFDNLNNENAWILGWMATDGYVRRIGNSFSFGLKLAKKDEEIIYKIKEPLKFNGKIYQVIERLRKTSKDYRQVNLKITSEKIVKRLNEFGIIETKTKKLEFPALISQTEDEFIIKSFSLGAFEGDGSILFDETYKSPCFQIVGTKEFLSGIQKQIMKYLGLPKTKLTKNIKNSNHYALRYRGRFQAIKIFDWLYSNPMHFLKRKHERYLEIKRRLSY
ncbi:MAG: hypothetical protein V1494_07265 [Candidatus Diapherotrites archaeon]